MKIFLFTATLFLAILTNSFTHVCYAMTLGNHGTLFLIAGPSCAGKTTLTHAAVEALKNNYPLNNIILYTTRQPRLNEKHCIDYFFLTPEAFKEKAAAGFFMHTVQYDHHWYGCAQTVLEELQNGLSFFMIIDHARVAILKKLVPNAFSIWLQAPTLDVLKERLKKRYENNIEAFNRRFALAQQEIEEEQAQQIFDYHIINDDFDVALQKLCSIIADHVLT